MSLVREMLGGKCTSRCTWSPSPLNWTSSTSKSAHTSCEYFLQPHPVGVLEDPVPVLGHEHQVSVEQKDAGRRRCEFPVELSEATDKIVS